MKDGRLPSDDLLELVFGDLDERPQAEVRRDAAKDPELAAAVRRIEMAVEALRSEHVGWVSDAFNDRLRRRALNALDFVRTDATRPSLPVRFLTNWRWIMRSPVSHVTAAVVLALAIAAVALWFHGGGTTPAFADFTQPILDAKSAKFKMVGEAKGQPVSRGEIMVLAPHRSRVEQEVVGRPGGAKIVTVTDMEKGKMLTLVPALKTATVTDIANRPKEKLPGNFFLELRSLLRDARQLPDFRREPLGEKDIDGRRVVGYRLSGGGIVTDVWGDPKAGMLIRLESTVPLMPDMKVTYTDFVFDVDLDESLFSVEPPAGYTTQNVKADFSPPGEKDLIETFRRYSQLSNGAFPDTFDMQTIGQLVEKRWNEMATNKGQESTEAQSQKRIDEGKRLTTGFWFVNGLPPQADPHYAGKGVSVGKADTPIFWYRPKDATKYRVIYADLSVREADAAPTVPNAQLVPAQPRPKQ